MPMLRRSSPTRCRRTASTFASTCRRESVDDGTLTLSDGSEVAFDRVLVATGRRPNVDGLEPLGLTISRRGIEVDERMRAAEDVWALGDVTGIAPFTHVGKYHARVAAYDMDGRDVRADHRAIPATIFTDPQVAMVGDTEGGVASTWELVGAAACDLRAPEAARVHQGRRRPRAARPEGRGRGRAGVQASGCSS